jgi:hypothetical protein
VATSTVASTPCLRFGELACLRWSDVDLDKGTVGVARQYSHGTWADREFSAHHSARGCRPLRAEARYAARNGSVARIGRDDRTVFAAPEGGPLDDKKTSVTAYGRPSSNARAPMRSVLGGEVDERCTLKTGGGGMPETREVRVATMHGAASLVTELFGLERRAGVAEQANQVRHLAADAMERSDEEFPDAKESSLLELRQIHYSVPDMTPRKELIHLRRESDRAMYGEAGGALKFGRNKSLG